MYKKNCNFTFKTSKIQANLSTKFPLKNVLNSRKYQNFQYFKILPYKTVPNMCNDYVNLLYQRKNLELSCRDKMQKIDIEKIKRADEEKLEAKMKIRLVLREYIEELNAELELMTTMVEDVGSELVESQSQYFDIEKILKAQEKALTKVEHKNQEIERKINDEVLNIRKNFAMKWTELDNARQKFTEAQQGLENFCTIENELELELKARKVELYRVSCCIKSARHSKSATGNVTEKMLEEICLKQEKYEKICRKASGSLEYRQQQICRLQQEMEIIRKTAIIKLNVAKLHDNWKTEKLLKRKEKLEAEREELSDYDESDEVMRDLRVKIKLMGNDVDEAKQTIENLQKLLSDVDEAESSCKKIIKPSTKGQPKLIRNKSEEKLNYVIARDYLGSTFIKLQ